MSDMRPQHTTIELGGKEYGLLFDLNAIDAIQDRFDAPISALGDLMQDEKKLFKVLKFILATLINEAIDDAESGEAHVTEAYIGRKITPDNLNVLQSAIFKAFKIATPDVEDESDPNAKSE